MTLSYKININESANATLDFLESRPVLKFSLFNMRLLCCMIIIIYFSCLYRGNIYWLNSGVTVAAGAWLLFRRKLNYFILCRSLTKKKLQEYISTIQLSKHKILAEVNNFVAEIFWVKISFIYKNKDGYILPLPGLRNAGRFIWLPLRSFNSPAEENAFLDIVKEHKLKIKNIKLKHT